MKVFIIGITGRVAKRHIKAWKELGVDVSGCGSDSDYQHLLSVEAYDIIDICTPIYLHAPMIKEAMKHAPLIICEKPVALFEEEAREIAWLNGKICIIYQFRFNPKVLQLKREIQDGKYGEIKLVTAQYYRFRDWDYYKNWERDILRAGGGTAFNVCIHYIDLLQWIFGFPEEVYGLKTTAKPGIDVEDTVVGIMKFPTGAIGSLVFSSHVNPPKHFELSVYGTLGHKTIQLRQNEYHRENFEAFLKGENYVTPREAAKSLILARRLINE